MIKPGIADLLRALFSAAPPGYTIELRNLPGGVASLAPADPEVPSDLSKGDWYFGVVPRGQNGLVDVGTVVWADFDGNAPEQVYPVPTATVKSGKEGGLHSYWTLSEATDVRVVVRLAKLAALTHGSDKAVCEAHRGMRLPGSFNQKYKPPRPCTLESLVPEITYGAAELEEFLVAAELAKYWDDGQRHQLAMAVGATLERSGWDAQRVENTVRHVCELTGDTEVKDRVVAAVSTLERKAAGTAVSAAALREAMGDRFRPLLEALGVTARDGDVLDHGVRIGRHETLERDLVEWMAQENEWAYADGRLHRWEGKCWKPATPEELLSSVFTATGRLKVVTSGLEHEFNATAKLASAVARVLTGRLMSRPMTEPTRTLVPVRNGVLDLTTGDLVPHDRELRNRWVLDVDYDPDAVCPTWEKFLSEACHEDVGRLLQDWVGYCLTSGNPHQKMLWLYGQTSTGKSTFLNTIAALFGPAVAAVTSGSFGEYAIAELSGKLVAMCSEISNRVLQTTTLKALVSSDVVMGRHPYGRPFPTQFTGKILWASNALPPVDQGEGVFRRLIMVPFVTQPKVVDKQLGDKIKAELSGVLNWAIEGWSRMETYDGQHDWPMPSVVTALIAEYREGADPWKQFSQDCLVLDDEAYVDLTELYQAYRAWATERGYKPEPMGSIFRQELQRVGGRPGDKPRKVGKKYVRVWEGLRLLENTFIGQSDDEEE